LQLSGSFVVSTQVVPPSPFGQLDQPDWHVAWHVLFTHCLPASHALPQPPQLKSSLVRSTQPPLQSVRPAWQVSAQAALLQTSPLAHLFAQPPQLLGSAFKSTQLLPQCAVPPPQTIAQTPCEHT